MSRLVVSVIGHWGKTTVAAGIAQWLAACHRDVCLVDLDLTFGDIGPRLGLANTTTWGDVVAQSRPTRDVRAQLARVSPHLAVLPAPLDIEVGQAITGDAVATVLDVLGDTFDTMVLDCPSAAYDDTTTAGLQRSNVVVQLVDVDYSAQAAHAYVKRTLSCGVARNEMLVVATSIAGQPRFGIAQLSARGIDVAASMPHDPRLRHDPGSVSHDLAEGLPDGAVSAALAELAATIERSTNRNQDSDEALPIGEVPVRTHRFVESAASTRRTPPWCDDHRPPLAPQVFVSDDECSSTRMLGIQDHVQSDGRCEA